MFKCFLLALTQLNWEEAYEFYKYWKLERKIKKKYSKKR